MNNVLITGFVKLPFSKSTTRSYLRSRVERFWSSLLNPRAPPSASPLSIARRWEKNLFRLTPEIVAASQSSKEPATLQSKSALRHSSWGLGEINCQMSILRKINWITFSTLYFMSVIICSVNIWKNMNIDFLLHVKLIS